MTTTATAHEKILSRIYRQMLRSGRKALWESRRKQSLLFVERIPKFIPNLMVSESGLWIPTPGHINDNRPAYESLNSAIVGVKQDVFRVAGDVLPENFFFIFGKSPNFIDYASNLIAERERFLNYAPAPHSYVTGNSSGKKNKRDNDNYAMILCQVAEGVDLNPLLGCGKKEGGQDPQWVEVSWEKIQYFFCD